jgi:hypothetical protein
MTPLYVGSLVLVRVWCRQFAQASVNNLWYTVAAVGASPATDLDVATARDADFASPYKSLLANSAEYRGVQAQIYLATPPNRAAFSAAFINTSAGPGLAGATPLPSQTCGLIQFQTGEAGQANRGRLFIPFPAVLDNSSGGTPVAGYVTRLTTLVALMDSGISIVAGARTATLVRVLRHGKNKAGVQPTPTPVTSGTASDLWATQRKRGDFGRTNVSPI